MTDKKYWIDENVLLSFQIKIFQDNTFNTWKKNVILK